jgi:ribosome-binding factor A
MGMHSAESIAIRRAKKAALFLREISDLFFQAAQDNEQLKGLYPNRVTFSADTGICTVLFFSPHGKAHFDERLSILKLFKPSLRSAIAKRIPMRRVPDFIFKYDDDFEKEKKLDTLIDTLKAEGKF